MPQECPSSNTPPRLPGSLHLALAGALLLSGLAGCSSTQAPPTSSEQAATAAETTGNEAGTSTTASSEPELPAVEIEYGRFSEDVLARSIMAELALQRGQNQEALDTYVALARETGNISIIQRAMRLATFLRDTNLALAMGELWLKQDPESGDARQMMAVQLVFLGRYRAAMDQMIWLLDHGIDIDFRLIPARSANDESAPLILEALIADYQDLLQRHPGTQSLRLGLAMLYEQNRQLQEAYAMLAELARETGNDADIVVQEVRLLELLGEEQKAGRRLQEALTSNTGHKQLRFLYGRKLITERRFREAKDQFTILVQQDPRDFDMLYSLALLSLEVNMLDDARQYLQRLVVNGQKLDDAHYYLGYIAAQENRPDEAITQFRLVRGGTNFLQALRGLTELMVQAGRYPELQTHLQSVRFRNPEYNIPLLSMEAGILIEQGQYAEARKLLDASVTAFPNNIQLLFQRSVLFQELNELGPMEADLRQIILLDPSNPVAYNSLGYTLADRTDRYDEAHELILKAIELAPNDPAILDSLGWVQFKLGRYDEARRNLERAYELFPDPEVAAHLGELYWVTGNRAAANRIWRSALEVEPDSKFVLNAMERLNPGASR